MNKIGIIGQGFVGSAVKAGFEKTHQVMTFDKFLADKTTNTLEEIVTNCNVIFVCIPTPMIIETGEAYTGYVETVVAEVNSISSHLLKSPTLVIKSTIPPGTTEWLRCACKNIKVTFSPEFLTEANHINDFLNQDRVVIGGDVEDIELISKEFAIAFPNVPIYGTKPTNAEMIKYVANCFLAVKVSFANDIYDICQAIDADYDAVIEGVKLDKRLGGSHWSVPGPDGDRGFGGHCFPKDMAALKFVANENGISPNVMVGALQTNKRVRQNKDWEKQAGRAVISINDLYKDNE